MDRRVKVPWVVGRYTIVRDAHYTMGREVDIPWVGCQNAMARGSIYHEYGGLNTMDREVDIPPVGGSKYHG